MYSCHVCSCKFNSLRLLQRHSKEHSASLDTAESCKAFVCAKCGRAFGASASLSKHEKLYHNYPRGKFKCKHCSQAFQSKSFLNQHLFTIHKISSSQKNYHCKQCQRSFTSENFLLKHKQIHKEEKDPSTFCTKCRKFFIDESRYTRHMKNHDISHVCPYCDTKFESVSKLSSHMIQHSSEISARFSCNECSLKFCFQSQLKVHLRTHSNEKPFICTICGKGFKRFQQRKIHHSLVHSKVKLDCPECEKKFGTEGNLFRHRLVFHYNLRRWICGVCAHNYCYSQDLRRHLMKKHNIRFDTLGNNEKKSKFAVYIIPDIGTCQLPDVNVARIKNIYDEEETKLNSLRITISSSSHKGQIALVKPHSTNKESVNRIVIDAKNEENISVNTAQRIVLLPTELPQNINDLTIPNVKDSPLIVNNEAISSFTGLNSHQILTSSVKYLCSICSNLFPSTDLCINHIKKVHFAIEKPIQSSNLNNQEKTSVRALNSSSQVYVIQQIAPPLTVLPQHAGVNLSSHTHSKPVEDSVFSNVDLPQIVQIHPSNEGNAQTNVNQIILQHNDSPKMEAVEVAALQNTSNDYSSFPATSAASLLLTLANSNNAIMEEPQLNNLQFSLVKNSLDKNLQNSIIPPLHINHIQNSTNPDIQLKSCANDGALCTSDDFSLVSDLNRSFEYTNVTVPIDSTACLGATNTNIISHSKLLDAPSRITITENPYSTIPTVQSFTEENQAQNLTAVDGSLFQLTYEKNESELINSKPSDLHCQVCKKDFSTRLKFNRHMKIHQKGKYLCQFCNKPFVEKFNLKIHLLIHANEKPLQCDICDKKFRYHRNLKDHLNSHKNVFLCCSLCKVTFVRQKDLDRHIKEIHTENNRFKCEICEKSFKRKAYLDKVHLPSHKTEELDSLTLQVDDLSH